VGFILEHLLPFLGGDAVDQEPALTFGQVVKGVERYNLPWSVLPPNFRVNVNLQRMLLP
jgi:hypothetical protein